MSRAQKRKRARRRRAGYSGGGDDDGGGQHRAEPSGSVGWRFISAALLWLIPGIIVLPFYLVLVAISVAVGDGSLLEITDGVRGGLNTAIGPLLIVCGLLVGAATAQWGYTAEHYVGGAMVGLVTACLGLVLIQRALAALRDG